MSYNKKWYEKNKKRILEAQRKRYRENKQKLLDNMKKYYLENEEVLKKYQKAYRNKYKNKHKKYVREWTRNKRHENICYKLSCNVSKNVWYYLKENNGSKNRNSTWKALLYTPQQLKEHLEKQFDENMTWENYGTYWTIDHIYPQSKLPFDSFDHPNFLKCWSLENLRPLEKIENIKKSNNIFDLIEAEHPSL